MKQKKTTIPFTAQEKFVILILALTQFTVILDFMIMNPMGDILGKALSLRPSEFGLAVSAYAFSAGVSGLLTAGFSDRFDRKKLLVFFYTGFILGTVFCGLADSYTLLVLARIITGLFGGVIGSISMAIIVDIFSMHQRGRVMGFVQMGFGASQVLGIPIGLKIAGMFGWHFTFLSVAGLALAILIAIIARLQPVTQHLEMQQDKNPLVHLWHTIRKKEYRMGFAATSLLAIGGYMMMPFGSQFAIHNLGIHEDQFWMLSLISGIASLLIMPLIGRFSDRIDKFKLFAIASTWMMLVVLIYTNLPPVPFWAVAGMNIMMMMGILSRMIPGSALITGVPEARDRGAFMSVNSSLSQVAGGVAAMAGGLIVKQQTPHSPIEHYNTLGLVVVAVGCFAIWLVYRVSRMIKGRPKQEVAQSPVEELFGEESILSEA